MHVVQKLALQLRRALCEQKLGRVPCNRSLLATRPSESSFVQPWIHPRGSRGSIPLIVHQRFRNVVRDFHGQMLCKNHAGSKVQVPEQRNKMPMPSKLREDHPRQAAHKLGHRHPRAIFTAAPPWLTRNVIPTNRKSKRER